MKLLLGFLTLFASGHAPAATINTYAGNGSGCASPTGAGGPATATCIFFPYSVALDSLGDVYFGGGGGINRVEASTGNLYIYTVPSGPAPLGDGGPAASAYMSSFDLVFDSADNLYVADTANHRVRKIHRTSGIVSTFAGNGLSITAGDGGQASAAALDGPYSLAVDEAHGRVYIGCKSSVRWVDLSNGTIQTYVNIPGVQPSSASIMDVARLCLNAQGDLFVTDYWRQVVWKVAYSNQALSIVAGTLNGFGCPNGDGGPATSGCLSDPSSCVLDAAGDLFICDSLANRVRRVDAVTGIISTVAGTGAIGYSGDGGPATAAQVSFPTDIAMAPNGDYYLADMFNYRVRFVSLFGPPTATATPSPTFTMSPTPSATRTVTASFSASPSPSSSPTITPSPSISPTFTISPTLTPAPDALLLHLFSANPAPAANEVWLPYSISAASDVDIQVWTLAGEKARGWRAGWRAVGLHEERWDLKNEAGASVGSGVYIYRIRARSSAAEEKSDFAKCAVAR